jgi:WD40 repeat protein
MSAHSAKPAIEEVARFTSPARGAFGLPTGGVVSWRGNTVVVTDEPDLGALRWSHDDEVVGASLLPDGAIASFAYDGSLALVARDGQQERARTLEGEPVVDVLAWAGQGRIAVSAAGTLHHWQPGDREARFFSSECDGDAAWWRRAVAVVDDQLVSFVSNDLVIRHRAHDVETHRIQGHTKIVTGLLPLPRQRALTWSDDGTLRIWNVRARRAEGVLEGHGPAVIGAAVTDDGGIVSWGSDGTARRWSANGAPLATYEHPFGVRRAAALPGVGVATLADDGVRAWTGSGAPRFWPIACPLALEVIGDRLVVIAVGDPAIHVMTPLSGASLRGEGHAGTVLGIAPMANGPGVLSWSQDGRVQRWDLVAAPAPPAACDALHAP